MESSSGQPKVEKEKEGMDFQIHPRADAIRSKLIQTFYLVDYLRGLTHAVPRYNIQDFLDSRKRNKMLLCDHHQLVRFHIAPIRNVMVTRETRWRNRFQVRCSRYPPLTMWASYVLNSQLFKGFIILLIFLNMICLMISTEIMQNLNPQYDRLKVALEVMIWAIILIFIAEILLHWIVNFQEYWNNAWNVFDFTVTLVSFVPELMYFIDQRHKMSAISFIQACRVLRCLKLFPRVRQVRVLIMAIIKALKAMAFILVLLIFFFYVFAVSGIFFFESYSRSDRDDLTYNMYFTDLPNALVTIFILFTMDHWYALLQDSWKVPDTNKIISGLFICLWLLIGAFIFRNLFVAIMVTNFQNIRNDLNDEAKQFETQHQADQFKIEILEKRYSFSQMQTDMGGPVPEKMSIETSGLFPGETIEYPSQEFHPSFLDWETYIHKNLPGLYEADDDEQVVWPRDSLFRYFELLEKLQYNLDERKQLQNYAILALSNLEDK